MTKAQPLQGRLTHINQLIEQNEKERDRAPKGSNRRKRAVKTIRKLKRQRRKLQKDKLRMDGATAIVKYEVIPLLDLAGVPVTSRKRWATFGNSSSDHYMGNTNADAVDGGTTENYELGTRIKRSLTGDANTKMVDYEDFFITRAHTGSEETYRVQIIAATHGTGPHLHIGVKRVSA